MGPGGWGGGVGTVTPYRGRTRVRECDQAHTGEPAQECVCNECVCRVGRGGSTFPGDLRGGAGVGSKF